MSPELLVAVKERILNGHTDESIKTELLTAGYIDEAIVMVLETAHQAEVSLPPDVPQSQSVDVSSLPGATTLLTDAFQYLLERWDLLLGFFFTSALTTGSISYVDSFVVLGDKSFIPPVTFFFFALIFSIFLQMCTFYIISKSSYRKVSVKEGLVWTRQIFWSFAWVYLLIIAVIYGGMVLFVIPGIIVSLLVTLAPYVLVNENIKGMDALLRSRDLVRGRWWWVAKRLFLTHIPLVIIVVVLSEVSVFVSSAGGDNLLLEMLTPIILQSVMGAMMSIISVYIGMRIYRELVSMQTAPVAPATDRWKYVSLGWLGVLLPVWLIVISIILTSVDRTKEKGDNAQVFSEPPIPEQNIDYKERAQNTDSVPENEDSTLQKDSFQWDN